MSAMPVRAPARQALITGLLVSGVLAAGVACAVEPDAPSPQVPVGALADMAEDVSGHAIDVATLAERLRPARYVLLGEVHDSAVQHRLRAAVLRALLADGRPTWVVFEPLDREHNAAVQAAARDVDAIVEAGQLDRRAWRWPLHRPLFEVALASGATVVAGNLSRAAAARVVRGGPAEAPQELQPWLRDAGDGTGSPTWTPALEAALRQQIDEGHCGALPPSLLAPMAWAQRARDAALASTMLGAPAAVRVVLIAGNGHVRRDTGVPHYLSATPVDGIVSVGFLERVLDGARVKDGSYDEVVYTAPVARADPCASLQAPRALHTPR